MSIFLFWIVDINTKQKKGENAVGTLYAYFPCPAQIPLFFFFSLVGFPQLFMSRPSSLFFPLRLSCIFSFVGFFCIRFCSPIGLSWLALSFFIGPASFETCCSAWCASWPPRVLTPLLHQYIQGWYGWPVISSVVVFAFFLHVNTLMHADTSAVIGLMSSVVFVSFSLPLSLYSFLCSLICEKNCSL